MLIASLLSVFCWSLDGQQLCIRKHHPVCACAKGTPWEPRETVYLMPEES